jgi:hypothetical protein
MADISSASISLSAESARTAATAVVTSISSPQHNPMDKEFNLNRTTTNCINRIDDTEESNFNNNNNNETLQSSHIINNNNFSGRPSAKSGNGSRQCPPHTTSDEGGISPSSTNQRNVDEPPKDYQSSGEKGIISPGESNSDINESTSQSISKIQHENNHLSRQGRGESVPMEEEEETLAEEEEEEGDAHNHHNNVAVVGPAAAAVKNEVMVVDEDFSQESENEMPVEYDDEEDEDSEKEEHRITVREALMSRAYQQQQAGIKHSTSSSGGKHTFSVS